MIDNLDTYRAANLLVERHGPDVAIGAARRADELLAGGNPEGCAIWKRILVAVNELTRTKLNEGDLDGVAVWRRILNAVEELQRTSPRIGERVNRLDQRTRS